MNDDQELTVGSDHGAPVVEAVERPILTSPKRPPPKRRSAAKNKNEPGHHDRVASDHEASAGQTKRGRVLSKLAASGPRSGAAPAQDDAGQGTRAASGQQDDAGKDEHEGDGHEAAVVSDQGADAAALDSLVANHRLREDYHRAEKRIVLQLKATCRRRCRGDKEQADALYKALAKAPDLETGAMFDALNLLRAKRKDAEAAVVKIARALPVAPWCDTVPGLSHLSLGQIVAETLKHLTPEMALDRRSQESKVNWRLGVGLCDWAGQRVIQRKTTDKALAERLGYSPRRRSLLFVIGDNLIRASNRDAGRYHAIYLARKAYEKEQHPELRPIQLHRRAKRYMEKKLVRHFLAEWNRTSAAMEKEPTAATPA